MTNLFNILDAYLSNADRSELDDLDSIIAYAASGMNTSITEAQAQRISDEGKRWLNEQRTGNGEYSRMREDAKRNLTITMEDLNGYSASFAEACYDDNSIDELRAALDGEADAGDCKEWGITENEWRDAINAVLNEKSAH